MKIVSILNISLRTFIELVLLHQAKLGCVEIYRQEYQKHVIFWNLRSFRDGRHDRGIKPTLNSTKINLKL